MPRLEYDVVFNIDSSSLGSVQSALDRATSGTSGEGISNTKKQVDRLSNSLEDASQEFTRLGAQSSRFSGRIEDNLRDVSAAAIPAANNIEGIGDSMGGMSKIANNSNQILFSFGDAVQDGAQFSQGFASGMRAVGNNLTFAAEQISIASARAGSFTGALRGIGSSLLGPAGIVFAVNAAVTAITLWSQSSERAAKQAESLRQEFDDLITSITGVSEALGSAGLLGADPFNIAVLENQQERINQQLRVRRNILEELGFSEQQNARIQELRNLRDQQGIDLTADQTRELTRLARQRQGNQEVAAGYRKEITALEAELEALGEEEDRQRKKLRAVAQAQTEASSAVDVFALRQKDAAIRVTETSSSIDDLAESFGKLPELRPETPMPIQEGSIADLRSRISAWESLRNTLDPTTEGYERLGQAIDETRQKLDDLTDAGKESSNTLSQNVAKGIQAILSGASQLNTSLESLSDARSEARLNEAKAAGASAEKIRQIEKERFENRKKAALAGAVINTAQGVTRALASSPPPFSFIEAGLVSAAGAIQIAAIKAQEFGGSVSDIGTRNRAASGKQGFNTTNLPDERLSTNIDQQQQQQINPTFILSGEFDEEVLSIKVEQGRKQRVSKAKTITAS